MDEYLFSHQPLRLQREAAGLAASWRQSSFDPRTHLVHPEWGVLSFPYKYLVVSIPTYPSGTVNRFQFPYLSFSRNKKSSIARSFLAAVVDITGQDTRLRRLVVGKHSSGRFAPIVGSKGGSHDHDLWMARTIIWRDGRRQRKYLDSTTPTSLQYYDHAHHNRERPALVAFVVGCLKPLPWWY